MKSVLTTPIQPVMCATCPWRPGSPYARLLKDLAKSALTDCSRICHSTGTNAIGGRTGKPNRLCRGARDLQLAYFHGIGFLAEPTETAWEAKLKEMGLKQ